MIKFILGVGLLFLSGCVTLPDLGVIEADKVSINNSSMFHSVDVNMIGGSSDEDVVMFEHVTYTQSNPFWSSKVIVEGYIREKTE